MRTVQIITYRSADDKHGIVGVFDDSDIAEAVFDALEKNGDKSKTFYLDTYTLNEISK